MKSKLSVSTLGIVLALFGCGIALDAADTTNGVLRAKVSPPATPVTANPTNITSVTSGLVADPAAAVKNPDVTPLSLPGSEPFVFRRAGTNELRLHVVKPEGWSKKDQRPCFVSFFGGGWSGGSPERSIAWAKWAASKGLVGVAPDYRTRQRYGGTPEDCVSDARAAVRWVEEHAEELGVDPKKIISQGGSAGGHVAAWTAIPSPGPGKDDPAPKILPAALVLLNPVTDTKDSGYGGTKRFGGDAVRALKCSVPDQMPAKMPPTIVFHATGDTTVPYANSVAFRDKLVGNSNRCELMTFEGLGHSYNSSKFGEAGKAADKKTREDVTTFLASLGLIEIDAAPAGEAPEAGAAKPSLRVVSIDYTAVKGPLDRTPEVCVGAGRAAEGLRKPWQDQLAYVRQQCGFQYVRFHGLFHDEMEVCARGADGKIRYNWDKVDQLYEAILKAGVKPFVELGFMPKALASADGRPQFWWKANVTCPKDYNEWGELVGELTRHLEQRFGREEVAKWFFEVWNEPNLTNFFAGSQADYFKLYDVSARAIKSVSPRYQVGGPATAGVNWVAELIAHCRAGDIPIDFISTHNYGTQNVLDEFGTRKQFLRMGRGVIVDNIKEKARKQIDDSAMPKLKLYITEWSASSSPHNAVHDSYFEAPYILDKLKGIEGVTDAMSYWTFTDIFEEAGPPTKEFHGGFGLLTMGSLKKPAFYAYQFLHRLAPLELANGDRSSWVTRESGDGGEVTGLIWDFSQPDQGKLDCNKFFGRDWPARDKAPLRFELKGMPPGNYILSITRVGYRANDVFASWLDMGIPDKPTPAQLAELASKNNGTPEITEEIKVGADGLWNRSINMRENDACFLSLKKKAGSPGKPHEH